MTELHSKCKENIIEGERLEVIGEKEKKLFGKKENGYSISENG